MHAVQQTILGLHIDTIGYKPVLKLLVLFHLIAARQSLLPVKCAVNSTTAGCGFLLVSDTMGFFNSLKRVGKLDNNESEACQRVMSSYPIKTAVDQPDQRRANPRLDPKHLGAKSFSYSSYSRAKVIYSFG
jgi:hypothetical protein